MQAALRFSDELIDELLWADAIVIATPKYNFGVPAALKAWIDQIVRVHRTFRMPGFEGLAQGRLVWVLVASGSEPASAQDHLTPFLRQVFRMIGIDDIEVVPVVNGQARWRRDPAPSALQPAAYSGSFETRADLPSRASAMET
jgi:FMN-dependent NADH-azoreductase